MNEKVCGAAGLPDRSWTRSVTVISTQMSQGSGLVGRMVTTDTPREGSRSTRGLPSSGAVAAVGLHERRPPTTWVRRTV
jgi:hypothetical protein